VTLAEITPIIPIASQLVRVDITRQQGRDGAQRQGGREVEDGTTGVIRERQDIRQTIEVRARLEDAARDGEPANSVRPSIDLSADAIFDPDLPRGSIIDILV